MTTHWDWSGTSEPKQTRERFHVTAIVEVGADVGADTVVWHWAHVRAGATIGQACMIGQGAFIDAGVVIGNGVRIQNHVSVYRGVVLEDRVFVGPHVAFTNDRHPRADAGDAWDVTPTVVRQGASIGANATILCGVTIGAHAMVGAGAVVTHDVPAYGLVVGKTAQPTGNVCLRGRRIPALSAFCVECLQTGRRPDDCTPQPETP